MAVAAAEKRGAPTTEIGVDLIAAVPTWEVLGGALRGHSVDREEVSELRWPRSVRIFNRMRNDSQLSGLYRGTTLPIRRYIWGIDPNGAAQGTVDRICRHYNLQTIDKAWQAFLTGQSDPTPRRLNRFVFDRHSTDGQRAIYFGHYYFELHGAIGDDGLWHPEDASPRSPWTIAQIFAAVNGDLIAIKQNVGLLAPELDAGRLVTYVFDQEPGDWTGRSMFRSCYREWLLKDRLLRVDLVNHEKAGGVLLNEAPAGATPAQLAALSALAAQLQAGGGGAVPAGTNPVFIRGTGSDVIGSINRHDESMAREFLMMFMALGTSSSGGNRALAGSFLDWFAISQEAIAIWQRDTFQRDVIDRDVLWNDGETDYVPQLVFKRPEAANPLDKLAATVVTADQAGAPGAIGVQQGDQVVPVAAVRYGDGGRLTLVPKVVVDGDAYEEIQTAHADYERFAGRAPSPRRKPAPPAAAQDGTLPLPDRPLRRDLYAHEISAQVNFAQIDSNWQTQADALVGQWQQIRAAQIAELASLIRAGGDDLAQLAQIRATAQGGDLIASHLATMASLGAAEAAAEASRQGVTGVVQPDLSTLEAELAARAAALEQLLASALSQAAANKAVQLSGGGLEADEVAAQVADYLASLSDTYLADQFGGALSAAQNAGRLATMSDNQASRLYASELLDSNTCPPCAAEDGREFATVDEAAADYPAGGFKDCDGGPRCRGTIVAVYEEAAPSVQASNGRVDEHALAGRVADLVAAFVRSELADRDSAEAEVRVRIDELGAAVAAETKSLRDQLTQLSRRDVNAEMRTRFNELERDVAAFAERVADSAHLTPAEVKEAVTGELAPLTHQLDRLAGEVRAAAARQEARRPRSATARRGPAGELEVTWHDDNGGET